MAASGKLKAINDHLIVELLKDPNYKITNDGKIFTKLTLNGQGISDEWREMGYKKPDGYIRIRYNDDFLFVDRVIYQKYNGDLKSDHVIDHNDRDRSNNHPSNLKMIPQSENNKNKRKKYRKSKILEKLKGKNMKASVERILNAYFEQDASKEEIKTAAESFNSSVELDMDADTIALLTKIKKDDIDLVTTKKVKIKWEASFIYRDWGFNIKVNVPDQKIKGKSRSVNFYVVRSV